MKKIGMIGGIGPESTVDYYHRIIKLYQERIDKNHYPEIIINSIDMTNMLQLVSDGNRKGLISLLSDSVNSLHEAGADFAFIASNTPHIVFDQVQKASPIPLVSIVEAARKKADDLGLRKAGLLGTLFTMQSDYYQNEFDKSGIKTVTPNLNEQQYIRRSCFPR
jgi:aspartate racemase